MQVDQLGSPFQVRTLAGTVVWRWESEAYGKTQPNQDVDGDGTQLTLNLRFPGQYYDQESGLHYNLNRYYSPKLARYLTPDPIGLAGGANVFAYVDGNPVNANDPSGLTQDVTIDNAMRAAGLQGGEQWSSLKLTDPCVRNYLQQNYGQFVAKTIPVMSLMSLDSRSGARDAYVHSAEEAVVVKGTAVGAIKGGQMAANSMGLVRTAQALGGVITAVEVGAGLVTGYSAFATTAHLMAANACSCAK